MMKVLMKKLTAILFVVVLSIGIVNVAAEPQIHYIVANDNVVVLPVSYEYAGNDISVIIYEGIVEGDIWLSTMPKPVFMGLFSVGEDNRCISEFVLDEPGTYTAIIGTGYSDETTTLYFTYVNQTDYDKVVTEITDCIQSDKGYEELLQIIDAGIGGLPVNRECYIAGDKLAASLLYTELKKANTLDQMTIASSFEKAYLLSGLKNSRWSNIDNYIQSTGILGSEFQLYYDSTGGRGGELIGTILTEMNSIEEYDKRLGEAVCLSAIAYSGDTSLIKEILKNFDTAISASQITDEVIRMVNGEIFTSFDALNRYIEELLSTNGNKNAGGGNGGGSANQSSIDNSFLSGMQFDQTSQTSNAGLVNIFNDIEDVPWAKEAIEALFYKGILQGRENGNFAPHDNVLREEFVKMLVMGFELNTVGTGMTFEDVDDSQWYAPYVKCAYYSGIVKGESETAFGVGKNITRQDLAVMAYNTCLACDIVLPTSNAELDSFSDENEIAEYAKTAVEVLKNAGILNGANGAFHPYSFTTRAEAAKVLYGFMQYME